MCLDKRFDALISLADELETPVKVCEEVVYTFPQYREVYYLSAVEEYNTEVNPGYVQYYYIENCPWEVKSCNLMWRGGHKESHEEFWAILRKHREAHCSKPLEKICKELFAEFNLHRPDPNISMLERDAAHEISVSEFHWRVSQDLLQRKRERTISITTLPDRALILSPMWDPWRTTC